MFRAIVFDFDGTLVDSNSIKREGFFRVAERHGGSPTHMADVLATVGGTRRVVLDAYVRRLNPGGANSGSGLVDTLTSDYNSMVDASVAQAQEIPGATRLLDDLRRSGARIFLSSATPLENLQAILATRNWADRFDHVYGYPGTKVEALCDVLVRTGCRESELAVVGDGEDDRRSAREVGCAYFPVGEARGTDAKSEGIYPLPELMTALTDWNSAQ